MTCPKHNEFPADSITPPPDLEDCVFITRATDTFPQYPRGALEGVWREGGGEGQSYPAGVRYFTYRISLKGPRKTLTR